MSTLLLAPITCKGCGKPIESGDACTQCDREGCLKYWLDGCHNCEFVGCPHNEDTEGGKAMFYTKDLYLDAVSEEGGQELYKLFNDYDIQVGIEGTADFVVPRTYKLMEEAISGGGLCFLVRQRIDDAVVGYGSITVNWITHVGRPTLFIGKPFRGKGYGKQLIALLMYVAFQEVNGRKMALCVYSFNMTAINVYQSANFKVEGVIPEEVYRNGQYWDVVYMGLFRDRDWREYHRTLVRTGTCPQPLEDQKTEQ